MWVDQFKEKYMYLYIAIYAYTANEGPVRIQNKCLVPILCIPRNEIVNSKTKL